MTDNKHWETPEEKFQHEVIHEDLANVVSNGENQMRGSLCKLGEYVYYMLNHLGLSVYDFQIFMESLEQNPHEVSHLPGLSQWSKDYIEHQEEQDMYTQFEQAFDARMKHKAKDQNNDNDSDN